MCACFWRRQHLGIARFTPHLHSEVHPINVPDIWVVQIKQEEEEEEPLWGVQWNSTYLTPQPRSPNTQHQGPWNPEKQHGTAWTSPNSTQNGRQCEFKRFKKLQNRRAAAKNWQNSRTQQRSYVQLRAATCSYVQLRAAMCSYVKLPTAATNSCNVWQCLAWQAPWDNVVILVIMAVLGQQSDLHEHRIGQPWTKTPWG